MKTVLGKPSTPSPRFAAWCDQAILYPYWYVPRSITFNGYLPIIRQNPSWLDAKNMQVVDGKGKEVDHHRLNWSSFHAGYFPYTIRQSTGCDNALGVIKFNISTPYGVYLHDTNNKTAFFPVTGISVMVVYDWKIRMSWVITCLNIHWIPLFCNPVTDNNNR